MGSEKGIKIIALDVLTWVDIATYTCTLLFGIRNTAKYLVKQGKWRQFYLSMFYLFTFVVMISGIIDFIATYLHFRTKSERAENIASITDFTAFYGKVVLGAF